MNTLVCINIIILLFYKYKKDTCILQIRKTKSVKPQKYISTNGGKHQFYFIFCTTNNINKNT